MSDGLASGVSTIGTFNPIELYAGEPNGQTTQGTLASGNTVGQTNDRGATYKFPVVALVSGYLVPWNPLGDSNVPNAYASGTLTIANAVPVAGDKFTVNGHDITFRAAANPNLFEVTIGASVTATATALKDFINAHRTEFDVDEIIATSSSGVVTVKSPGVAGNAVTLAKTFATGANGSVSGATLSGGTDSDAEVGGAQKVYGILPHALDASGGAIDTPVFISGHFNFGALDVPDGTTYAELKAAAAGTMINIQKLY